MYSSGFNWECFRISLAELLAWKQSSQDTQASDTPPPTTTTTSIPWETKLHRENPVVLADAAPPPAPPLPPALPNSPRQGSSNFMREQEGG